MALSLQYQDDCIVSPSEADGVTKGDYTLDIEWLDETKTVIHNTITTITVTASPDLNCQMPTK